MEGPDGGARDDDRPDSDPNGSEPNPGVTEPETGRGGSVADGSDARGGPPGSTAEGANGGSPDVTIEDDGVYRWLRRSNDGTVVFVRDVLTSVAIVAVVALVLFAVSGIWPPLVAVESGSMEPNMQRGDLIFVVDEGRFVGDDPVEGTGVVTSDVASETGHERFGEPGDVIIFEPDGADDATPVIHRAHFWVEAGENWVETKANPEYTNGRSCAQIASCPAPHDGFVTKGDANRGYDQAGLGGSNTNDVVKPEWIEGKALLRIPYLGYVRLTFDSLLTVGGGTTVGPGTGATLPGAPAAAAGLSAAAGGVAGTATVAVGRRR